MKNLLFTSFVTALGLLTFLPKNNKAADNQAFTSKQSAQNSPSPIDGAWELFSTESGGKTTLHKKPAQIKVYHDGYFCMMSYNLMGKFEYGGAGTYELDGNHYKETITYGSGADGDGVGICIWFDWSMKNDTLLFYGFKKVIKADGMDITKDWGGDSFVEKKVRVKK